MGYHTKIQLSDRNYHVYVYGPDTSHGNLRRVLNGIKIENTDFAMAITREVPYDGERMSFMNGRIRNFGDMQIGEVLLTSAKELDEFHCELLDHIVGLARSFVGEEKRGQSSSLLLKSRLANQTINYHQIWEVFEYAVLHKLINTHSFFPEDLDKFNNHRQFEKEMMDPRDLLIE